MDRYYPNIVTLREYVLAGLPRTSRIRRKKIACIGTPQKPPGKSATDAELALGRLLDSTLVAFRDKEPGAGNDNRWEQWIEFSQKADESYVTLSGTAGGPIFSQDEVGPLDRRRQCSR